MAKKKTETAQPAEVAAPAHLNQWTQPQQAPVEEKVFTGTKGKIPQILLLDDIVPDPKQPRKFFDEKELQELAHSIAKHEVLQPVLLRPNPDFEAGTVDWPKYIIVFGERRWRASKIAEKADIPAYVEPMSELEAIDLQLIENSQRKDVHMMHEAGHIKRSYDAGFTIQQIADKIGHSERYVAARLQLCDLIPDIQDAFAMNLIDYGTASKVAKATHEMQAQAFAAATKGKDWRTTGEINDYHLDNLYGTAIRNLDNAPFKTEDPDLNPAMGACSGCRFNTANTPNLFLEDKRECSNSVCYRIKELAQFKIRMEKEKEKGTVFINTSYASKPKDFSADNRARYDLATELGITILNDNQYNNCWKSAAEAKKDGAIQAFVVIGHSPGEKKWIYLKKTSAAVKADTPAAIKEQITNKEINLRRKDELDNVKLYNDIVQLMKNPSDPNEDWVNKNPLTKLEKAALARSLFNETGFKYHADNFLELSYRGVKDKKSLKQREEINAETSQAFYESITDEELNLIFRLFIRYQLTKHGYEKNHVKDLDANFYVQIAKQYRPEDVQHLELQYENKANIRHANAQAAIKKLQEQLPAKKKAKSNNDQPAAE